ncbi:MAG TPA: chromate resistance protein ChrB domain-containing protein [Gemmatimonadaceae bacterium]|nr:chromate resistance protein ChrB domain-containing protein [Gemmatimonadaceae bacterium]
MSQVYHRAVDQSRWLLLIHRLPPKPDYLRVKVKRRLDRIGALAIKNSVYVLPERSETTEDFEWLAVEIQRDGGEVLVCRSEFLAGISDEDIVARFNSERNDGYRSIRETVAGDVRESEFGADTSGPGWRETIQNSYAAAQRRLDEVARLDFFGAEGRSEAEEELRRLHDLLQRSQPAKPDAEVARTPPGATWVTRAGVFVDRMASAWLIRRFIDREAIFRFVSVARHQGAPGEVRFDMMPAEYTHEGDRCTFEVLLDRFKLRDPGLVAISELVHDIDLKDEKFARSEAPGIEAVLTGIVNATADDDARLAAAFPLFDALYDRFRESAG